MQHAPDSPEALNDFDIIMRANATRIFSEPDAEKRLQSLAELWTEDGVLIEPDHLYTGWDEISRSIGALLHVLPPGTTFAPVGAAVGHHGIGRLRWQAVGSDGRPGPVSGTDIAFVDGGRITRLYVILDPPA
jgi:hypothetical protein